MRDFELDDAFWREAIEAFRGGDPGGCLTARYPAFGELVAEFVEEAAERPVVVGLRLASPGQNPRLLALIVSALLVREGHETLLVDLGADVRWLETALDRDFKEGVVDHLQYGMPIEQCVRATELDGLSVLSGGAYFLAGSPLDDAPGFRAAVERLRGSHRVVVLALPPPIETVDAAGVIPLCDAVVTVEEEGEDGSPVGTERAVVRLTGDPRAARDLVRWTRRFLGPLPRLLVDPDRREPRGKGDEAGETNGSVAGIGVSVPARGGGSSPATSAPSPAQALAPDRFSTASSRRWVAGALAAAVGIVLFGFAAWRIFGGADGDPRRIAAEAVPASPVEIALDEGAGRLSSRSVPDGAASIVAAPSETAAGRRGGQVPADASTDAIPNGRPAPWSVHVGSYLSESAGEGLVERIAAAGELAFVAPVDLPGKGRWYRVYVGAYGDSTAARRALGRVVEAGLVEEGMVRSAPMAFRLGAYADRADAERARDSFRARGVPAYLTGEGPARVWAGAYASREEAEPLARVLAGIDAEWTLRQR